MINDIKKNSLKKVYLLYGNEMYLKDYILSYAKKIIINNSFESLNMVHIDGKETSVDEIVNACETLPFMSEKKIVVIEELPLFTSKKEGINLDEEELIKYLSKMNDLTCLIFVSNEMKIDNRKKIVKTIKQNGKIIQLSKLKEADLIKWIENIFSKNKKEISKFNIQYFIREVGYYDSSNKRTLYDLENEIVKICNYLGNRTVVQKEDIEKGVIRSLQSSIFALVDALGQRRTNVVLSIFNDMITDNEPIQLIFHMIIRQIKLLLLTKLYEQKGYSQGDIAQKINTPTFVVKKLINQSRNFSENKLHSALNKAIEVDRGIKKGQIEWRLAIEIFISELSK